MKLIFVTALILVISVLSSCKSSPAKCIAGEPSRTRMIELAAQEIVVRMKRRNEPNGFSGAALIPGCCYVTKRRPSLTDRSTYFVEMYWNDPKRKTSHSFQRKLDECGGVIDERGY
jgi:hypothetical protein